MVDGIKPNPKDKESIRLETNTWLGDRHRLSSTRIPQSSPVFLGKLLVLGALVPLLKITGKLDPVLLALIIK